MIELMSGTTTRAFKQLFEAIPVEEHGSVTAIAEEFNSQSKTWVYKTPNLKPVQDMYRTFEKHTRHAKRADKRRLEVALTAYLALASINRIRDEKLPDSILAYYPRLFDHMARELQMCLAQGDVEEIKPIKSCGRFLFTLTVPAGAEDFDLADNIPITSSLAAIKREKSPRSLLNYLRGGWHGVWFRSHTNTNFLEEFNEAGFDDYYARIAELLLRRPHVRGLVSTSWFHDPQLSQVSPRLAFLHTKPLERGAVLMRHGTSPHDIEFATRKSESRRKLYEQGRYLPVMYSLVWKREPLIAWANSR